MPAFRNGRSGHRRPEKRVRDERRERKDFSGNSAEREARAVLAKLRDKFPPEGGR